MILGPVVNSLGNSVAKIIFIFHYRKLGEILHLVFLLLYILMVYAYLIRQDIITSKIQQMIRHVANKYTQNMI